MYPSIYFAAFLTLVFAIAAPTSAGSCWHSVRTDGSCQGLSRANTTMEECCSEIGTNGVLAFSDETFDDAAFFRYNALRHYGGAPRCRSCRKTCEGIDCGENKVCQMQGDRQKCVCRLDCEGLPRTRVCGSNGKTYRNQCSLLHHNCHYNRNVSLNYYGKCRSSCSRVNCPAHKACVVSYRRALCVSCVDSCPTGQERNPICGADGVTYENECEIRAAGCRRGTVIAVAYRGDCPDELE